MQLPLQGKRIAVVGAAGRIGAVISRAVLDAGARVIALDANEAGLQALRATLPGDIDLHCAAIDIADRASVERAIAAGVESLGELDGAVNAAYPRNARYGRSFFEVEYADFCENTSLHLGGYFLFMQACARHAEKTGRRFSLVNLSSIYGAMTPRFDVYAGTPMTMPVEYAAIKAGLVHITRYLNAYMKGRGVRFRANCVSPGGILAGQNQDFLDRYNAHCMTKGMLDSADITGSVVYLLSDASTYVAGQDLIVDDGFSL